MVAHQAVDEAGARSREVADHPDDAGAVRPAIDIVTQEDDAAGPAGGVGLDFGQKNGKKIAATVDVADRIDQFGVDQFRLPPLSSGGHSG